MQVLWAIGAMVTGRRARASWIRARGAATVIDFLNTTKYPPRLLFIAMTLGPAAILCAFADRVYGVWLLVIVLLYPLCRRLGDLKARSRAWWLSYV